MIGCDVIAAPSPGSYEKHEIPLERALCSTASPSIGRKPVSERRLSGMRLIAPSELTIVQGESTPSR